MISDNIVLRRCMNTSCRVETFKGSLGVLALMGCPVCLMPGSIEEIKADAGE